TPISYLIGVPPPMTEVESPSPMLGFVPDEVLARRLPPSLREFFRRMMEGVSTRWSPSPNAGFVPDEVPARCASLSEGGIIRRMTEGAGSR
ncbi:MAG: hypothetical protein ACI3XR_09535, partial [Eubacteriales bacterium]